MVVTLFFANKQQVVLIILLFLANRDYPDYYSIISGYQATGCPDGYFIISGKQGTDSLDDYFHYYLQKGNWLS